MDNQPASRLGNDMMRARRNPQASRSLESPRLHREGVGGSIEPAWALGGLSGVNSQVAGGTLLWKPGEGVGTRESFDQTLEVKSRFGHSMLGIGGVLRLRNGPCGLRHVPMLRMTLPSVPGR